MRVIGFVMSGADHTLIPFALKVNEHVEVGDYVLIRHPHREGKFILARVLLVKPYNPEMKAGRPGPHEASRGGRVRYGNWIEYRIAYAEPLGYYDDSGKWRSLECAPSSWEPVYEPTEEELKEFFRPRAGKGGLLITIGHVSKHEDIPVQIDLSEVAKGHMFICGMTRSGKSTFVVNLVIHALRSKPKPRIIIIDRRGEYSVLSDYGAFVFDYRAFLPRPRDIAPNLLADVLADLLGVPAGDKTIRDYMVRIVSMIRRDMEKGEPVDFTPDALEEYVDRLPGRIQEATRERLRLYLDRDRLERLYLLKEDRPFYDIVDVVREHPVVIVDLSTDPNVIYQHLAVANMIRRVVHYAIERARRKEPFAAIFVIEEAQYIAPEKGMKIEVGAPEKLGVDRALIEGVSQAGGYNVGFVILTQRPAYVAKSVISQCNTILCFRLRNPNDQDTIARYTEYGSERLTAYLPGLADFEGVLCGMASTIPFPVMVETHVMEYPRKATVTAREAWEYMDMEIALVPSPTMKEPPPEVGEAREATGEGRQEAEIKAVIGGEVEGSGKPKEEGEVGAEGQEEAREEGKQAEVGDLGPGEGPGPSEGGGAGKAARRRKGKPIFDLFEPPI